MKKNNLSNAKKEVTFMKNKTENWFYTIKLNKIKQANKRIGFFDKNGWLTDIYPAVEKLPKYFGLSTSDLFDYIVYNGKIYNMDTEKDILSFTLPDEFSPKSETVSLARVFYLYYQDDNRNYKLKYAYASKALESAIIAKRVVNKYGCRNFTYDLLREGLLQQAEDLYSNGLKFLEEHKLRNLRKIASRYDLIYVQNARSTSCQVCSKYLDRVYSVRGIDKRFPKLPSMVLKTGKFHEGCSCDYQFTPYYELNVRKVNLMSERSKRPFVDNRSPQKKEAYRSLVKWDALKEKNYEIIKNKMIRDYNNSREYYILCTMAQDVAPKSYSAYCRMKHMQTERYVKLKAILDKYDNVA